MLKAIIFDMDGVLVNSIESMRKSFAKVLEMQGIDTQEFNVIDKERFEWRPLRDQLQLWETELWIYQSLDVVAFSREAHKHQLEIGKNDFLPNPSTLQLIKVAREKGIKIAVATSSRRERAVNLLTLVDIYDTLDAFISYEDIINGKPNPECFLKAAEALAVDSKECVVIEDAVNGIQAAKTAGMKAIARVIPERRSKDFDQADLFFWNFEELLLLDIEKLFIV